MKKLKICVLAALFCCLSLNAFAAENDITKKEGMNWSISMMPEQTEEEKEAARWSIVVENEVGINAYDMDSIRYEANKKGEADKNIMSVLTRTVYAPKNKELQKRIETLYKDKLGKKEKLQSSNIRMIFNMAEKTYYVATMDVYSNKNTLLEHKENPTKFKAIPAGSIAEAMYEICYQAAHPETATTEKK